MADEMITVDSLVNAHAAAKAPQDKNEPTPPSPAATPVAEPSGGTTPPADPVGDLLKDLGVESLDALKERLKPKVEAPVLSPEEREKQENLYQVDLQRYAVENGIMKPEEFVKLQTQKSKDDRSLVYEQWLPSWKEENPNVDPDIADQQARQDFESEYHLNSQNDKTKARAEARLAREAGELRKPSESAYTRAKTEFDEDRTIKADYPEFNKKVSGFIQENIPEKVKFWEGKDGDEAIPVEITLTADQRKEVYQKVSQKIMNSGTYQLYKKGDMTQLSDIAKREAEAMIRSEHRDAGLAKIAETFLDRGRKKGSNVGAKQPFPLQQNPEKQAGGDQRTAQQQVLDSLNGIK